MNTLLWFKPELSIYVRMTYKLKDRARRIFVCLSVCLSVCSDILSCKHEYCVCVWTYACEHGHIYIHVLHQKHARIGIHYVDDGYADRLGITIPFDQMSYYMIDYFDQLFDYMPIILSNWLG
jgi:hypothetical protein